MVPGADFQSIDSAETSSTPSPTGRFCFVVQIIRLAFATFTDIAASNFLKALTERILGEMVIVLHAVGLPLEGIGAILAVDWFLDRCRTTVNVWGNSVGAAVIANAKEIRIYSPFSSSRNRR